MATAIDAVPPPGYLMEVVARAQSRLALESNEARRREWIRSCGSLPMRAPVSEFDSTLRASNVTYADGSVGAYAGPYFMAPVFDATPSQNAKRAFEEAAATTARESERNVRARMSAGPAAGVNSDASDPVVPFLLSAEELPRERTHIAAKVRQPDASEPRQATNGVAPTTTPGAFEAADRPDDVLVASAGVVSVPAYAVKVGNVARSGEILYSADAALRALSSVDRSVESAKLLQGLLPASVTAPAPPRRPPAHVSTTNPFLSDFPMLPTPTNPSKAPGAGQASLLTAQNDPFGQWAAAKAEAVKRNTGKDAAGTDVALAKMITGVYSGPQTVLSAEELAVKNAATAESAADATAAAAAKVAAAAAAAADKQHRVDAAQLRVWTVGRADEAAGNPALPWTYGEWDGAAFVGQNLPNRVQVNGFTKDAMKTALTQLGLLSAGTEFVLAEAKTRMNVSLGTAGARDAANDLHDKMVQKGLTDVQAANFAHRAGPVTGQISGFGGWVG